MTELTAEYAFSTMFVMLAATYLTRILPFVFLSRYQNNRHLIFVGEYLPPAVMVILVFYCIKDVSLTNSPHGLPELLSIGVVASFQVWKRNTLLSVFVGTAIYMYIVTHLVAPT